MLGQGRGEVVDPCSDEFEESWTVFLPHGERDGESPGGLGASHL
jgi:hypothetical protein